MALRRPGQGESGASPAHSSEQTLRGITYADVELHDQWIASMHAASERGVRARPNRQHKGPTHWAGLAPSAAGSCPKP